MPVTRAPNRTPDVILQDIVQASYGVHELVTELEQWERLLLPAENGGDYRDWTTNSQYMNEQLNGIINRAKSMLKRVSDVPGA